jgi:hypothetical protein
MQSRFKTGNIVLVKSVDRPNIGAPQMPNGDGENLMTNARQEIRRLYREADIPD